MGRMSRAGASRHASDNPRRRRYLESVLGTSRVAVVDDDASVREALKALLRAAGFRVDVFGSAEEFLGPRRAADTACLVLDVQMPGMSGLELQRVVASGSAVPIVFMTAHADANVRARALASGAVQFLEKPFDDEALLEAIEQAIGVPRASAPE
jgi:FixJ family two-component response regulator